MSDRAQRARQQHEQQQQLWCNSGAAPQQPAAREGPQRKVDAGHADLLWSQSAAEEESARVLAEGARHAHAVWHAQQACELALKSLMMRTCGVLEQELRGKDAHDLLRFVDRVDRGGCCPVPRDELRDLTKAYLWSRYPDAAAVQLPVDRYTATHAQTALRSAGQLRLWLSSLDTVTTPRTPFAAAAAAAPSMAAPAAAAPSPPTTAPGTSQGSAGFSFSSPVPPEPWEVALPAADIGSEGGSQSEDEAYFEAESP